MSLKDQTKISKVNLTQQTDVDGYVPNSIKELSISFGTIEGCSSQNLAALVAIVLKCTKDLKINELIFKGISSQLLTDLLEDQESDLFSHLSFLRFENLDLNALEDLSLKADISRLVSIFESL